MNWNTPLSRLGQVQVNDTYGCVRLLNAIVLHAVLPPKRLTATREQRELLSKGILNIINNGVLLHWCEIYEVDFSRMEKILKESAERIRQKKMSLRSFM